MPETLEQARTLILELQDKVRDLEGERDALKSDNAAKDEKIDTLRNENSRLYMRCTTRVENQEAEKPKTQDDLINELCEKWK